MTLRVQRPDIELASFPDPLKAKEDLNTFAKLNENRLFKLAKTCMDPQTDVKGLAKATVRSVIAVLQRRSLRPLSSVRIPQTARPNLS
jgi:hypothetical protein